MQKERQQSIKDNAPKREKAKVMGRWNAFADKKLISEAAELSGKIAHEIKLQEEQGGRSVDYILNQDVVDAAGKVMKAFHLDQYFRMNGSGVISLRVGDEYLRGKYYDLKKGIAEMIAAGKDISNIEIVSMDDVDSTKIVYDDSGKIISATRSGDEEIERNKKRREQIKTQR